MEILIKSRLVLLFIFLAALASHLFGAIHHSEIYFSGGFLVAAFTLFLLILTESYGRLAQQRSSLSRVTARFILVIPVLVTVGFVVYRLNIFH